MPEPPLCNLFVPLVLVLARAQLPPASQFTGLSGQSTGGHDTALQDAVEGIAGLMQRFEQFQPQLAQLPQNQLEAIALEGQKLHERFLELQGKLRKTSGPTGVDQRSAVDFHGDLALFLEKVEGKLGIMGPQPPAGLHFSSQPPEASGLTPGPMGASSRLLHGGTMAAGLQGGSLGGGVPGAGFQHTEPPVHGAVTSATDRRLQDAMRGVMDGMQRFQALHPKLQLLSQPLFQSIASRGQRLHEQFESLQKLGTQISGDGRSPMLEAHATPYADQLETFVISQSAFVADAERSVQEGSASGSYGGMLGAQLPVPPRQSAPLGGGFGAGLGGASLSGSNFGSGGLGGGQIPAFGAAPVISGFGSPSSPGGGATGGATGIVTAATDQRLSAVIKQIVDTMNEFEALKPELRQLPQQVFQSVAARGQQLQDRFVVLQQRGSAIAGDGRAPMRESDAGSYADAMQAFQDDQGAFCNDVKSSLRSSPGPMGGQSGGFGSAGIGRGFGGPSAVFGGLPSAGLPGGLPAAGLGCGVGSSGGTLPSTGFGVGLGGFGRPAGEANVGFGGGNAGFGSGGAAQGRVGGSASGNGVGSLGGFGASSMPRSSVGLGGARALEIAPESEVRKHLSSLSAVQLDTALLPEI